MPSLRCTWCPKRAFSAFQYLHGEIYFSFWESNIYISNQPENKLKLHKFMSKMVCIDSYAIAFSCLCVLTYLFHISIIRLFHCFPSYILKIKDWECTDRTMTSMWPRKKKSKRVKVCCRVYKTKEILSHRPWSDIFRINFKRILRYWENSENIRNTWSSNFQQNGASPPLGVEARHCSDIKIPYSATWNGGSIGSPAITRLDSITTKILLFSFI